MRRSPRKSKHLSPNEERRASIHCNIFYKGYSINVPIYSTDTVGMLLETVHERFQKENVQIEQGIFMGIYSQRLKKGTIS